MRFTITLTTPHLYSESNYQLRSITLYLRTHLVSMRKKHLLMFSEENGRRIRATAVCSRKVLIVHISVDQGHNRLISNHITEKTTLC